MRISRQWTGLCKRESANDYILHLRKETFVHLSELDGFLHASILKRDTPEGVEFLIVTEWESLEAIKQFAGQEVDKAVVPSEVQKMMIHFDKVVRHYEIHPQTS